MRRPHGDQGAYAILYGLLLLVVLGATALVVDLGALRQDRRMSRLASDAASLAGARSLDPITIGHPRQACIDAWSYVHTNLGVPVPGTTGCDPGFPTDYDPATTTCPILTPSVATATSEDVTVTITWPVANTSPLMTANVQPADSATTAQAIDPLVDGTECSRLAVTIAQAHDASFASVFGVGTNRTSVTSVARATAIPGEGEAIAALNVLNKTACNAINMSGQAFLQIQAIEPDLTTVPPTEGRPGIISVESNGRQNGTNCPNAQPWVINAAANSAGSYIRADAPIAQGGAGKGLIFSWALNASPVGNPPQAFNAALAPPNGILLRPKPTLLSRRTGETPVTDLFQCSGTCTTVPQNYIQLLQNRLGSGPPQPYPYADPDYNTTAFQTLTAAAAPGFNCTIGNNAKVAVPAGNWFVDCATLRVNGVLVFKGGTIVTRGGIDVAGGCFAVNVAVTINLPTCATVTAANATLSPPKAAIVYMRGGNFTNGGASSIFLPRTFVYMSAGHVDFSANGQALYWTNPRATDPACESDECLSQRFAKLSLWNQSNDNGQAIGGQAALTLRGVIFTPRALFTYTGQAAQNQTNAQFWADRLEVKGQGGVTMAPNPTDSVATPALSTALIR